MLILSRIEGDEIVITVGKQRGRIVVVRAGEEIRLGFRCPENWIVNRSEVQERIDGGEPRRTERRSGSR